MFPGSRAWDKYLGGSSVLGSEHRKPEKPTLRSLQSATGFSSSGPLAAYQMWPRIDNLKNERLEHLPTHSRRRFVEGSTQGLYLVMPSELPREQNVERWAASLRWGVGSVKEAWPFVELSMRRLKSEVGLGVLMSATDH